MNAEFLEKNIVIRFITFPNGQQAYTAKKIRKNLAPISFIGAMAVTEDGTQAYRITRAKMVIGSAGAMVFVRAGSYMLYYRPDYGTFDYAPLS